MFKNFDKTPFESTFDIFYFLFSEMQITIEHKKRSERTMKF